MSVLRRWWCLIGCCCATGCLLDPKGEDPSAAGLSGAPSEFPAGSGVIEPSPLPGMGAENGEPGIGEPNTPIVEADDAPSDDDVATGGELEQTESESASTDADVDVDSGAGTADSGADAGTGNPDLQGEAGAVTVDAASAELTDPDAGTDAAVGARR